MNRTLRIAALALVIATPAFAQAPPTRDAPPHPADLREVASILAQIGLLYEACIVMTHDPVVRRAGITPANCLRLAEGFSDVPTPRREPQRR